MFHQKKKATALSVRLIQVVPMTFAQKQLIPKRLRKRAHKFTYHIRHKEYIRDYLFKDKDAIAEFLWSRYGSGTFVLQTSQWCWSCYTHKQRRGCRYGTRIRHGQYVTGWWKHEKKMRKMCLIELRGMEKDGETFAKMNVLKSYTLHRYKWLM